MKYISVDEFVDTQEKLLKLEQESEIEEQKSLYESQSLSVLEKRGVCVRNLQIEQQNTGLYGRFVAKFSVQIKDDSNSEVSKSHKMTPGDIVGLHANKADSKSDYIATGIVTRSGKFSISVAFDEEVDLNSTSLYRLSILTNDVTYRRLKKTLQALKSISSNSPCARLLSSAFPCIPAADKQLRRLSKEIVFFNQNLDSSQQEAVKFVLSTAHPISVIHGPPGTGKTTTVVEVIEQAVKLFSMKILVCAPSNIAVDNLVEKLHSKGLKVVRLGHPARVVKEVQKLSLDAILMSRDSSDIITSVRAEISSTINDFKKYRNKTDGYQLKQTLKTLRKELSIRENKAIVEVLEGADVILSTTTSSSKEGPLKHLKTDHFDLLIIDEAAQAMEISCWVPMLQVPKCILAGDHKQLPPTIVSAEAAKKGLCKTLLERVAEGIGGNVVHMLTTQYRMHQKIMEWPSNMLYKSKLVASSRVARHLLCDISYIEKTVTTSSPLVFVDTAGCDMYELVTDDEQSKGNTWEVDIIVAHLKDLTDSGVRMKDVGVITPYNLQVSMLRKIVHLNYPDIEINSVDGFQGREKEAILISMVRSNDKGEVGFLAEDRRINVAITRARRHLFVVADSQTISKHPFLKSLCVFLHENADVHSGRTFINIPEIYVETPLVTRAFELPDDMLNKNKNVKEEVKPVSNVHEGHAGCKISMGAKKKDGTVKANVKTDSIQHANISHDRKKEKSHAQKPFDITSLIETFMSSSEKELVFPSTLTAKDRAKCHEKAEEFGLSHQSIGEGNTRRIMISKSIVKKDDDIAVDTNKRCDMCKKLVPLTNFELHFVRCERTIKESVSLTKDSTKQTKKSKKKTLKIEERQDEDIDSVLESFAAINSSCSFQKCSKSIKTLGQKCLLCSQMFCFSHFQAEIHGCGDAAKIKARQDIAKHQGFLPKKMNEIKKGQVQRKLNNKLKELENERRKNNETKK